MENRLETTDSPISSSEAKKSYLMVKNSRTLAIKGLIPQEGKQIADNDQTETDYTGSRITTDPPAKSKEGLTQQFPAVTQLLAQLLHGLKPLLTHKIQVRPVAAMLKSCGTRAPTLAIYM